MASAEAPTNIYTPEEITWVEKLAQCESGNQWDIKVWDKNEQWSYSGLQFQLPTFVSFGKKYGILRQELTEAQAEELIFVKELQEKVAIEMYREGVWRQHWVNCSKKI